MQQRNDGDELRHYGVLGMKWGVRRARRTAKSAGRAKATAKAIKKDTIEVAKKRSKESEAWDQISKAHTKKGQKVRSKWAEGTSRAKKELAKDTKQYGLDDAKRWMNAHNYRKEKAYKLADKYKMSRKEVDSLIKQYSNRPYTLYTDGYGAGIEKEIR